MQEGNVPFPGKITIEPKNFNFGEKGPGKEKLDYYNYNIIIIIIA